MLVKLRFTSGRQPYDVFKIFDHLINNRPATGTDLKAYLTTAGLTSTVTNLIDSTNSQIWNSGTGITALTGANTVSKFGKNVAVTHGFIWAVEQTAYDNTNYKHVSIIADTTSAAITTAAAYSHNTSSTAGTVVSGFTGDTISSYNFGTATVSTTGTISYTATLNQIHYSTSFTNNTTTGAWLYITDNCFLWCLIGGSLQVSTGFPAGGNLSNFLKGHSGAMQYTRTDPWNTSTSGIVPFVKTYQANGGGLLGEAGHITNYWNAPAAVSTWLFPLYTDKLIDSRYSTTNTTGPIISNTPAILGCGNRFSNFTGLTAVANTAQTVAVATPTGNQTGAPLFPSAGYRYINSDLKSQTYALIPMTWASPYYNVSGGNITDKTGVYWFNGDYFPGDMLTSGTKTYVLFPGAFDNSNRVALAVPRE